MDMPFISGEGSKEAFAVVSLRPSRGASGYLRKKLDEAIEAGFRVFKIRLNNGRGLYPNQVLPIVATLAHYSDEYGCRFIASRTTAKGTYAGNIGLLNPYRNPDSVASTAFLDKVWLFNCDTHFDIVSGIVTSLREAAVLAPGLLQGIEYGLNEISDNVLVHSSICDEDRAAGYVMAQVHHQSNKVAISVFDSGVGIPVSLKRGGVLFQDPRDAIGLALNRGVTDGSGAGNGLWLLDRIVSAAAGSLDIQSDGVGYRKVHAESTDNGIVSFRKVGTPVPGSTLVDFQVSLDAEISMQDIFEGDTPVDLWREERELDGLGINLRLNLKKEAGGFGSRFDGAKMRNLALNMANSAEGYVVLDFSGVPFISLSFADEFVGKLLKTVGLATFVSKFCVLNFCEACADAIDYVTRQGGTA